jgi:hypothetical protein
MIMKCKPWFTYGDCAALILYKEQYLKRERIAKKKLYEMLRNLTNAKQEE